MIAPRWIKLWRDAVAARGRLALIVAAVAASVAALATMAIASAVLGREVPRSYRGSNPASAQFELAAEPGAALLGRVRGRPGIAQAELAATLRGRIELAPGQWAPLLLFVVPDFRTLAINTVHPEAGAWPPADGSLLVERSALPLTHRGIGGAIAIELPHAGRHDVSIAGTVHDPGVAPAAQEQTVYGYLTPATLAALGETVPLTVLKVVVSRQADDAVAIERVSRDLAAWLDAQGCAVEQVRIPPPGRHPHQAQMDAILAMLTGFSALSLVLGAVLCATVVGAWLAQQVRQTAIMKAIGARSRQVALPTLALVALLGLVATVIGLPLGAIAAEGFIRAIAQLLNLRLQDTAPPGALLALLAVPGIALPLLAALWPVLASARRSVRAALDDHGTGDPAPARWTARVDGGSVALTLALRNSLRRRTRLALTLVLLASAGAMLETSLALRTAWTDEVARAAQQRHWDIDLALQAAVPWERVAARLRGLPALRAAEPWSAARGGPAGRGGVEVVHTYPDGGHGGVSVRAAPPDTTMIAPRVVEGRWLRPDDADAVVLNTAARRAAFPGARLGDTIALAVGHATPRWRLVGVIDEALTPGAAYANPAAFDRATGDDGAVSGLRIALHDRAGADAALAQVSQALARDGLVVRAAVTGQRLAAAQGGHVAILVGALGFIALLMGVVGVLGLASALSVAADERTREFGVMRALGARRGVVLRVVLAEGLVIGVASWALAMALSLPLSAIVGRVLDAIASQDLAPRPGAAPAAALLLALLVGAVAASIGPALRASRWSVRRSLALA